MTVPTERFFESQREVLLEHEAKELLGEFGVSVPNHEFVESKEAAQDAAEDIGYPVVMKVVSRSVLHKSDVGGVKLGIRSQDEVAEAYDSLYDDVLASTENADISGVLVEEMVDGEREVFMGMTDNENFGPVVMVGLGGVTVELFEDVSIRLPPLDESTCRSMLSSLRSYPLLTGYRGDPRTDVDSLVETMLALAGEGGLLQTVGDDIAEIDLNPIIVRADGEGCVVSDALVELQ